MKVKEESERASLKLNIQNTKIWSHHCMVYMGKNGNSGRFYLLGPKITADMVTAAMKLKDTCSLEEKL